MIAEINALLRDLDGAASELNGQRGIGAEKCVASINQVRQKYLNLKRKLERLP